MNDGGLLNGGERVLYVDIALLEHLSKTKRIAMTIEEVVESETFMISELDRLN